MNSGAEFHKFRNRFFQLAHTELDWNDFYRDGTEEHFHLIHASGIDSISIRDWLKNPDSLPSFLALFQMFLWAMEDADSTHREDVVTMLSLAQRYSPGIDFGIARRGDTVTLYPQGAPELDKALVEEPMEWLAHHPRVAEQFGQALRIVLAKDEDNYRGALDNLRWSLEQLLKALLGNRKSLDNQSEPLLQWMKEQGVNVEIRGMYRDLLQRFSRYQNDAVKHGDKWQPAELEFMIYTTGALMRLAVQTAESPQSEE
jgi:hypothetical protein